LDQQKFQQPDQQSCQQLHHQNIQPQICQQPYQQPHQQGCQHPHQQKIHEFGKMVIDVHYWEIKIAFSNLPIALWRWLKKDVSLLAEKVLSVLLLSSSISILLPRLALSYQIVASWLTNTKIRFSTCLNKTCQQLQHQNIEPQIQDIGKMAIDVHYWDIKIAFSNLPIALWRRLKQDVSLLAKKVFCVLLLSSIIPILLPRLALSYQIVARWLTNTKIRFSTCLYKQEFGKMVIDVH